MVYQKFCSGMLLALSIVFYRCQLGTSASNTVRENEPAAYTNRPSCRAQQSRIQQGAVAPLSIDALHPPATITLPLPHTTMPRTIDVLWQFCTWYGIELVGCLGMLWLCTELLLGAKWLPDGYSNYGAAAVLLWVGADAFYVGYLCFNRYNERAN